MNSPAAKLLIEAADSIHATINEAGISDDRKAYRAALETRLREGADAAEEVARELTKINGEIVCLCNRDRLHEDADNNIQILDSMMKKDRGWFSACSRITALLAPHTQEDGVYEAVRELYNRWTALSKWVTKPMSECAEENHQLRTILFKLMVRMQKHDGCSRFTPADSTLIFKAKDLTKEME